MVSPVRKRLFKPLAYALVAAQLLLAVPAMAFSGATPGPSSSIPCDQMDMAAASANDHCPCCPDGAQAMQDCLASCTLAAAAMPCTYVSTRTVTPPLRVAATPTAPLNTVSDPPLKPPPIR
jgi:hypothetical protein